MSQLVQRAWRPTSTRPHRVATQRRFKTFQRRVDKNNDVYYTIAKRRPVQDPDATPESQQFFEMPNLLLDLDAEGTRNVRTYEDKDEELQKAKWRVNPKREEVKVKLNDLEGQLMELRKRAKDITASPANIWRLTSHDLLSAALHGPSENESSLAAETACPDSLEGSHLINALRRENGIPSHVSASDVLLLEWMLLRRHNTGSAKSAKNEAPLSAIEMVETLQLQSSITGIRRLLLHNLRSWAALKASFGMSNRADPAIDVAATIRRRCIEILGSEKAHNKQFLSCLVLVGNLLERIAKAELKPDHRLQGLALRTAAHTGSLIALSEWTHRICSNKSWESGPEVIEDAAACMQALTKMLTTQPETLANRQLLLQIVTGLDEHEKLAPESLRSIALGRAQGDGSSDVASQASDAYATLLGELGAVRTLLKESESTNKALKTSCTKVLKGTPKYSETLKTQGVKSLSIEECVSKDYHDVADSKRKDVDGVVNAIVETSGPAVKRLRVGRTGDEDGVAVPSTARARDNRLGVDEISGPEQQERRSRAVVAEVKREQTEPIKEECSVESHTARFAKKEELREVKDEETESSSSLSTAFTTSGRRQRRSAAPSPFSSVHSASYSRRLIVPEEVPPIVLEVLTPSAQNPGRCPCGWYQFYAVCTHLYQTESFKCGARTSRGGVTVFCGSPAPRHNIDNYIVNQPCPRCPNAAPAVLPPHP